MEKQKMQQAAYRCIQQVEEIISEHRVVHAFEIDNLESIKYKLRVAKSQISDIESSHGLLHQFFFALCEQLDAVFYDRSYKRGLFGHCQLQQKIMRWIYYNWNYFNTIAFDAQKKSQKQTAFAETIAACERLFFQRKQRSVPTPAENFISELLTIYSNTTYEQLCQHIKYQMMTAKSSEKQFYRFLLDYFINHPPLVGRSRTQVMVDVDTAVYVDIWKPTKTPKARILYLHGWHDSPDSAKLMAQLAINAGIELHAIHLPGHGLNYSRRHVKIAELQSAFLTYYHHLSKEKQLPLVVAGYSMGGAIIASCLDKLPGQQPKQVVLFAPAFSAKQLDLLQEKLPLVHKNLNPICVEEKKKNLLYGGRGPLHPLFGMISTLFTDDQTSLYSLMQQGYRQFTAEKKRTTKVMLVYGQRDHCVNYNVLQSIENQAEIVIRHPEFDHGPHLFPGCGGTLVSKLIFKYIT